MKISSDKVVQFHYRLNDQHGVELENSHGGEPVFYMHGHNGMMPGLEKALVAKEVGDVFSVTLAPQDAYGERKDTPPQRVPKKHLITKGKITAGMLVQINTKNGQQEAMVVKVGLKNIDVDTNHPLAGKTLTFDIEVVDIRAATEEEMAHGHAHKGGSCGH